MDFLSVAFILITLGTIAWFTAAARNAWVGVVLFGWAIIQSVLGILDIYLETDVLPPRIFIMGLIPTIVAMIVLFTAPTGRKWIDSLNLKTLTWLHVIRVPVEIVLLFLFLEGEIPEAMTFEGSNWDIISGVTAPVVALMAFGDKMINKKPLFGWNVACLVVLLNVVITGILSAPFPLQQLNFDQPAIGLLYFPYCLLPTVVVPVVIFSHLVAIRQLTRKRGA